jgi:hydrogenase maturation protein HypF
MAFTMERSSTLTRLKLAVRGAVQGVGFRPFVYRLATELGLRGWVNNSPQGVFIEVEGVRPKLEEFLFRLEKEKPPRSSIQSLEASWLDAVGYLEFEIRESDTRGSKTALVLPDMATCPDCLREIFDPTNRRHLYPFTNCTNCGPRFSIIEALPYDRANTSMEKFPMCPECQAEYDNPRDRRFHAQPNACPVCGPRLEFWERGSVAYSEAKFLVAKNHTALQVAAKMIRRGGIVAVKGIGGFHLVADAGNERAVSLLRKRKHREEKPFALMFPSLDSIKAVCEVSPLEERLLRSPETPIVLLKRLANNSRNAEHGTGFPISEEVAPANPNLGVMLPSNPLHHILMAELGFPVVATSGNLSDEPICTDELEALERLHGIADGFLVHNRPILRHVDDSIVRVMMDREMVLRRARGYAPLPVQIQNPKFKIQNCLAVGAHLKNSVAFSVGNNVFISQHIGDLETEQANNAFVRVTGDLQKLYEAEPEIIAADLHPDYLSTKFAEKLASGQASRASRIVQVQHHIAHVLSCIAENEVELPALGVAWDGTGFGSDGTIWGGEFFLVTDDDVQRVASLRRFRLPGGDAAAKEPRRVALALVHECAGCENRTFSEAKNKLLAGFSTAEIAGLKLMLDRGINAPWCSSVGRLFDAVASLIGLRQQTRFEGQAAMALEFALEGVRTNAIYPLPLVKSDSLMILDWRPLIHAILTGVQCGVSAGEMSATFHNTLVEAIVNVAKQIGIARVALSGGCFQNRYLTERTVRRLREENFQPYWHQRVPPNDGGIALGQIVAALRSQTNSDARPPMCDVTISPRYEIVNRKS